MNIKEFLAEKFNFEIEYKFTMYNNYPSPFNPVSNIAPSNTIKIVRADLRYLSLIALVE